MLRQAEQLVSRAQHLKARPIAAGWARDDPLVQRGAHRGAIVGDAGELFSALLMVMTRLPMLPRIRAMILLVWLVGRAPVEVTRLQEIASAFGLKWRTVERAKKQLGVRATRRSGHWYWQL